MALNGGLTLFCAYAATNWDTWTVTSQPSGQSHTYYQPDLEVQLNVFTNSGYACGVLDDQCTGRWPSWYGGDTSNYKLEV